MGRKPKTGWSRKNFYFEDDLEARIQKALPYEGASDMTSFIFLACSRLVNQVEQERAAKRKR